MHRATFRCILSRLCACRIDRCKTKASNSIVLNVMKQTRSLLSSQVANVALECYLLEQMVHDLAAGHVCLAQARLWQLHYRWFIAMLLSLNSDGTVVCSANAVCSLVVHLDCMVMMSIQDVSDPDDVQTWWFQLVVSWKGAREEHLNKIERLSQ